MSTFDKIRRRRIINDSSSLNLVNLVNLNLANLVLTSNFTFLQKIQTNFISSRIADAFIDDPRLIAEIDSHLAARFVICQLWLIQLGLTAASAVPVSSSQSSSKFSLVIDM